MADTALIRSGTMEFIVRSSIITSSVKTIPANGALNIAAMPAAAPQPSIRVSVLMSTPKKRPTFEPIAAPVSTIGASAPTDPPNPIVMLLATIDEYFYPSR